MLTAIISNPHDWSWASLNCVNYTRSVPRLGIQNCSFCLLLGNSNVKSLSSLVLELLFYVFVLHIGGDLSSQEGQLHGGVRGMAGKQEKVPWLNHKGESHEHARVSKQSQRHSLRNLLNRFVVVKHCCADESPVGSWSPEVNSLWAYW